jgi:8-oxo-dGTP pyrophosphatase MutT (NUDIX family)
MSIPTRKQVSAGGVAFRRRNGNVEVALISVGESERWQLPKGLIGRDEAAEAAALREVAEETGLETTMVGPLDTIEYWYYSTTRGGKRIRFHKYVHYFLLHYESGSTANHDHEVNEARWFPIDEAAERLAFENEKEIVSQAQRHVSQLPGDEHT